MSWFEHLGRTFGRVIVPGLLLGTVALASACGFQPLYGRPADGGPSATDSFAQIRIAPLPDRIGQRMHNMLRDRLNPQGQPSAPDYQLEVRLREVIHELGIRKDETATRANLRLTANFTLSDARTGARLLSGESRSVNSYNILQSQFATLFSEDDARERSLRELSDDIRTRLGVYFARVAKGGA
jgi:LPS-assembly lipoprotein